MKKIVIILFALLLIPIISFATSLPFSTTFNCAGWEWGDGDPTGGDCGDVDRNSGGTQDCGGLGTKSTEIVTAANHSAGGGGGGLRFWIKDGTNLQTGSLKFYPGSSDQQVLYIRFYIRYQAGFTWSGSLGYDKWLYFNSPSQIIEPYEGDGFRVTGTSASCASCAWTTNSLGDGNWHYVEIYLNATTEWVTVWIDDADNPIIDSTSDAMSGNWDYFFFKSNQNQPSNTDCEYVDIDDLAVQSTRIGEYSGTDTTESIEGISIGASME